MILRRRILPRSIEDTIGTLFVVLMIPMVYYFEMFVVLPHYYSHWSTWYTFHFVNGTFIFVNVCSNYVAVVLCDTSIKGKLLPTVGAPGTRFCEVCQCITPPRSWHCSVCNTCITKRDHHCMFTSCCVGHHNLRYFMGFVFYIFLATVYASYYNLVYALEVVEILHPQMILMLIIPCNFLLLGFSFYQMCLFILVTVFFSALGTGGLLCYYCRLIVRGVVMHERHQKSSPYDYGLKKNVIEVLGEKWYLVWLSPLLKSKLPQDGVNWNVN